MEGTRWVSQKKFALTIDSFQLKDNNEVAEAAGAKPKTSADSEGAAQLEVNQGQPLL